MPKYKNITGAPKIIGGVTINPGEVGETLVWTSDKSFERVSELPLYNPVILSKNVTADEVLDLPESEKRLSIHIYVERGNPKVYLSSEKNDPPLHLYSSARWNMRFYDGVVKNVRVLFDRDSADNSVWINVERI
jgi:hypothetical protein